MCPFITIYWSGVMNPAFYANIIIHTPIISLIKKLKSAFIWRMNLIFKLPWHQASYPTLLRYPCTILWICGLFWPPSELYLIYFFLVIHAVLLLYSDQNIDQSSMMLFHPLNLSKLHEFLWCDISTDNIYLWPSLCWYNLL